MPELPEVETVRRQLAPRVEGRVLERVRVHDPRWCMPLTPRAMQQPVQGRRVESLGRRGKYLVWELSGERFQWRIGQNYVGLTPGLRQAHVLRVER